MKRNNYFSLDENTDPSEMSHIQRLEFRCPSCGLINVIAVAPDYIDYRSSFEDLEEYFVRMQEDILNSHHEIKLLKKRLGIYYAT